MKKSECCNVRLKPLWDYIENKIFEPLLLECQCCGNLYEG